MKKKTPMIEVLVSMLSYYLAITLFLQPTMFDQLPEVYEPMGNLAKESTFAFLFIGAATVKMFGVMFNILWLRKIGLAMSMVIYLTVSTAYTMSEVPVNFGTGIFALLAVFCGLSIFEVKSTKL